MPSSWAVPSLSMWVGRRYTPTYKKMLLITLITKRSFRSSESMLLFPTALSSFKPYIVYRDSQMP